MRSAIWWIRRDLRLTDNQALQGAIAAGGAVIPLFILDPTLLDSPWVGEKRLTFLFAGLHALDEQLRALGSRLIVREGKPLTVLQTLCAEQQITNIHAERDHSPYAAERDAAVAETLPLNLYDGVTIRALGTAKKDNDTPYVVFTPYAKRWRDNPPIKGRKF
ncbi:MAG: deoxyribodipyrimidine photo-lyase [Caldilineaceae bacterium]